MRRARIREIARQFPQNGLKLLLEDPRNVKDLFAAGQIAGFEYIDFERMTLDPTTYVQRDYRHIEADLVLRAPLRWPGRREITIYVLLEHQSVPERFMVLRMFEYVLQVYKAQKRAWDRDYSSDDGLLLYPVLPIVFYTDQRPWPALGSLLDLVDVPPPFAKRIPTLEPLFLNLSTLPAKQLESRGGFLGWVLRLVQERAAKPAAFQDLLGQVVERLEAMPEAERLRWLELLSYVQALIYHDRAPGEHETLTREIVASVQADAHRQEVMRMGRTIADELIEKGRKQGRKQGKKEGLEKGRVEGEVGARRQTLVSQLECKFGELPVTAVAAIKATTSIQQLDAWLLGVVAAAELSDLGIDLKIE